MGDKDSRPKDRRSSNEAYDLVKVDLFGFMRGKILKSLGNAGKVGLFLPVEKEEAEFVYLDLKTMSKKEEKLNIFATKKPSSNWMGNSKGTA